MINLKSIIGIACVTTLMTTTAFADNINVSFNKTERVIELDGELGLQYANSRIIALIADANVELPVLEESDYINGVGGTLTNVVNMMQFNSDESGNYEIDDFKADPVVGNIKIYVAADTMEKSVSEDLFVPTKSAVDTFSGNVSQAENAAVIFDLLESENTTPYFGSDMRYYKKLSNDNDARNKVANAMYSNKKSGDYAGSSKIQKIDDDIFVYSYLGYLSKIDSSEELEKLLDIESSDYSTLDKRRISKLLDFENLYENSVFKYLNSNTAATANDVNQVPKNEILKLAAVKDMHTPELFEDSIYISTINYKFRVANGWRDAYRVLSDHIDILDGITQSKLDSIQNNQKLLSDIVSKTYNSVDSLCKAIKNWNAGEGSGGGGNLGGGSGGGGSSGGASSGGISGITNVYGDINGINAGVVSTPVDSSKQIFGDLGNYAWAQPAIEALYKRGIINGKGEGIYNPDGNVSREEFVKMVVNTMGINAESTSASFGDVDSNAWYSDYVAKAVSAGIITGMNSNTFGVGQSITRQDMAVIVCRAISYLGLADVSANNTSTFADSEFISDYAKDAVSALYGLGLVSGQGNNMFAPANNMTRAEAAVVMYNIINKFNL